MREPSPAKGNNYFMPTLYNRANELGLSLTHSQLERIGEIIAANFNNPSIRLGSSREQVLQKEDGAEFKVWSYSEDFLPKMDSIIRTHASKRKRIQATKINLNG